MEKRILAVLALLVSVVGAALIGCAPEAAPAEEEEAAPAAPAAEVFNWKVQGYVPAGLLFHDSPKHTATSQNAGSGTVECLDD